MRYRDGRGTTGGILLVLCLWALLPGAGQAQPETSRVRFVHWMYQDLGALAKATATPKMGLFILGTAGATAGLAWLDDDVQDGVHEIYHGTFKDALDVVDYLGGPKINLPVVLVAGGAMLTENTKLQDAAFTSFQTLVYAGLLGYGLKGIFGRKRPELTDDPYAFFATTGKNPFTAEGNSSYPSGHAIAIFGIITPWVLYYPSPVTYALYILPVGTSISRLARDKHWSTDIAVGATIGVLMGRYLTNRHQALQQEERPLELSFLEGDRLVTLRLRL